MLLVINYARPRRARTMGAEVTLLAIYIYLMSGHEIGAPQSQMLHSPKECHERLEMLKGEPIPRGTHEATIINPTPTIRAIVAKCSEL